MEKHETLCRHRVITMTGEEVERALRDHVNALYPQDGQALETNVFVRVNSQTGQPQEGRVETLHKVISEQG